MSDIRRMTRADQIRLQLARALQHHPEILSEIKRLALQVREFTDHWSIDAIYEVFRYQTAINTRIDDDDYKLNNNYRAELARLVMSEEPQLKDFFRLRSQPSEKVIVMVNMETLEDIKLRGLK